MYFENLAFTIPRELNNQEFICIDRDKEPNIYNKYNRTSPQPKILIIKNNQLTKEEYEKVKMQQNEIMKFFDENLNQINLTIEDELQQAKISICTNFDMMKNEVPTKY